MQPKTMQRSAMDGMGCWILPEPSLPLPIADFPSSLPWPINKPKGLVTTGADYQVVITTNICMNRIAKLEG